MTRATSDGCACPPNECHSPGTVGCYFGMVGDLPSLGQPAQTRSVHVCGFFDDDGRHRLPDGGAPSTLTPYEHFNVIAGYVRHFGGDLANVRTTRTLDGLFVGVEFETPERPDGKAARMWHVVSAPKEPWKMPADA